jgi:hypothetical protein
MPRKVLKKKPVKQKQSQRQSQNVVVNVVLAKHQAKRKPSGKKSIPIATPVFYQPPIRMIQSYGDVMQREPPKSQILGEDIRKIIKEEIKSPVAELREDFLSRVESRPKQDIIDKKNMSMYDFGTGFEESFDAADLERSFNELSLLPPSEGGITQRDPFLVDYDGATLEMLLSGNYGLTKGGNRRSVATKRQRDAINKYKNI